MREQLVLILTEEQKDELIATAKDRGYKSVEEYILALVEADRERWSDDQGEQFWNG